MANGETERIVISVGGSLIATKEGLNTHFLSQLNTFIREQLEKDQNKQFFLVVGGGSTARTYRDAGREVLRHELSREDLDWLGIHATRLNAHLVRTIFQDIAHQYIIKDYNIIRKATEPVVVASGWRPGWSTDYCAILLCEDYHVKTVVNLSNVPQVFNKDPKKFHDAKPITHMNWAEFRELVGDEWVPGMHAPFDPIASRKAQKLAVKVVIMGGDFDNLEKFFTGKTFLGTVIE